MKLYHASKAIVDFPKVIISPYTKDFSWGFYCTNNFKQAVRWANRGVGEPVINTYEYVPNNSLKVLHFKKLTEEWLDFIASCRSGKMHGYDIVEGPMPDDTVWTYVNDFLKGNITRKQFWALAEFRDPTHQISFHTLLALGCIRFIGSEIVYEEDRQR